MTRHRDIGAGGTMIGSFTRKTAWNRLMKKLKAKAAQSSGFTLIEVIFAIIVLSIVSITLLEMFTVSTKTNAAAGVLDKARSLCVEASEEFRANPVGPDPMDPADDGESAYLRGFKASSDVPGKITYTKYFNSDWEETGEDRAEYMLEIVSEEALADTIPASYYPAPAVRDRAAGSPASIEVRTNETIRLARVGLSDCELTIDSNTYDIDTDADAIILTDADVAVAKTALIPIHLDCRNVTGNIEVKVANEIGQLVIDGEVYEAIADIYLCDIPEGKNVTINVTRGVATSNEVSTAVQEIVRYDAAISVKERSSGRTIAESSVETFLVKNR